MRSYLFRGEINFESALDVQDYIDQHPEDRIEFYINSPGGFVSYAKVIQRILENHGNVHLIACSFIGSCAFTLFKDFNGSKGIIDQTGGMMHLKSIAAQLDERGEFTDDGSAMALLSLKSEYKQTKKAAKKYMTAKEFKKFKKGKDVYFQPARMQEIFKGVEVI